MQTLRVWEEKRGLTVAPLGSAQVTSPKVHGTLGPPTSHCPRGRSGSYTEPGAPGKRSGGTGLCVLQLFPVSYIVGIVSQAGKPSLLPHWPTDFQVSTLRCCKRQCVIRLIHHPRAGHQRGLKCYIHPAGTSASSARAWDDKHAFVFTVGGEQANRLHLQSCPGVSPVGVQHPSLSKILKDRASGSTSVGSLDLEEGGSEQRKNVSADTHPQCHNDIKH